jgi:hypothetical protein
MWHTFSRGAGYQKLNSSTVPMHYSLLYVCILQNDIFRKVSAIAMVLSLKVDGNKKLGRSKRRQ